MLACAAGAIEAACALAPHEGGLQNASGMTALMFAAKNGVCEVVEALIEKEVRLVTSKAVMGLQAGSCALNFARHAGAQDVEALLAPHEDDLDAGD